MTEPNCFGGEVEERVKLMNGKGVKEENPQRDMDWMQGDGSPTINPVWTTYEPQRNSP